MGSGQNAQEQSLDPNQDFVALRDPITAPPEQPWAANISASPGKDCRFAEENA